MTLTSKIGLSTAGVMTLTSVALLFYYGASGSYVAENGLLVEEFWALALGSFALLGALLVVLLTGVISIARMIIRKKAGGWPKSLFGIVFENSQISQNVSPSPLDWRAK